MKRKKSVIAPISNAVAIVRGKSGEKETHQADDVHPNNVTVRFKVIGHVSALMASKEAYELRKSDNQGETSKKNRWLWSRGSL